MIPERVTSGAATLHWVVKTDYQTAGQGHNSHA